MQAIKILTVDDSKMVRLMVGKAFKPYECLVLEASNGAEGLDLARREQPGLILLDYTMPVMDGLDTMTALRADPATRDIPVVMLTAEGSKDIMQKWPASACATTWSNPSRTKRSWSVWDASSACARKSCPPPSLPKPLDP